MKSNLTWENNKHTAVRLYRRKYPARYANKCFALIIIIIFGNAAFSEKYE